ncbi:MAG TPA: hypothetical protein VKE94_09015, partial [Gemmataceae bacterium]|nr:hypothetical protein [Gemmataceae bacterium]
MAIRAASSGRRTAPRRVARQVGVAAPRNAADMLQLHPELGNQAVLRLLDAYSASQRGVAARAPSVVQRFESQEHERIGNEATGAAGKSVLTLQLAAGPVDISYGEIVALSADWFSPDDRAPDGLFHLANIKGKGGSGVGTADEIAFAILEYNFEEEQRRHPDPKLEEPPDNSRFPGFKATKDVQKAVKDRYRNLGAKNGAHFVAPRGRDANGNVNPTHQGESSAGSNYRELHEVAITRAYALGRNNVDTTEAMAREAAAQHFLTDEFSAGHLRTPTADIRDHWASKYPLFWFNLRQKIALDTAANLWDEQIHFPFSAFTSPKAIYDRIIAQIMEVTSTYPEVSFGDLAAKIFHDYDNMVGLDIGDGGRVFGDAKLGRTGRQDDVTLMAAKEAVRAGLDDIKAAANLGLGDAIAGTPTRTGETLFAAVRTETGMSGSQYKPESLVPVPSSSNPEQNWKADNVESLWDMPMVVGGKYTAGEMIAFELQPGQEIDGQLQELGKQFPGPTQEGPITIDARMAYRHGFLQPMERDPLSGLLDILHWSPKSPALSSGARGDLAVETGKQLEKQKLLPGMTTPARIEYVKDLCGGRTGEDGEALVVRIFESAAAGERPQIYLGVEGHAWTGAFRGGFFKKDLLFKKLSSERLDRLKV